jgi:tetratricopeptide (TPR) repeat protein
MPHQTPNTATSATSTSHSNASPHAASQRFCVDCGARLLAAESGLEADASASAGSDADVRQEEQPVKFCGTCGKAQFSEPVLTPSAAQSAAQNQSQKLSQSLSQGFPKVMGIAALVALVLGGTSFGIARLSIEKPIEKPAGAVILGSEGSAGGASGDANRISAGEGRNSAQNSGQDAGGGQSGTEGAAPSAIAPELQQRITLLQDSLASKPNSPQLVLGLANAWYDAGATYQNSNAVFLVRQAFGQAEKLYARYLKEFDPKNTAARVDYAYTMLAQGRADDAAAETKRALDFEPNHPIALFNLGVIYTRKADAKAARGYFERAIKAAPDSEVSRTAQDLLKTLDDTIQKAAAASAGTD